MPFNASEEYKERLDEFIPAQPNYPFMMLNEPYENFEFVPNSL